MLAQSQPSLKHLGVWGREPPSTGGWGVKAERRGRRSWRLDKDVGLDYQPERGN